MDEWVTTKQACRDELVVYLFFSSHNIYIALLLCTEHCFTKVKIIYIYIYIYIYRSPDERAITKQTCRDESIVSLFFSPIATYIR